MFWTYYCKSKLETMHRPAAIASPPSYGQSTSIVSCIHREMVVSANWSIWDPRIIVRCIAGSMPATARADGLLWMRLAIKSMMDDTSARRYCIGRALWK